MFGVHNCSGRSHCSVSYLRLHFTIYLPYQSMPRVTWQLLFGYGILTANRKLIKNKAYICRVFGVLFNINKQFFKQFLYTKILIVKLSGLFDCYSHERINSCLRVPLEVVYWIYIGTFGNNKGIENCSTKYLKELLVVS